MSNSPARGPLDVTIVCVPYHTDVARWGAANGPDAYLDCGLTDVIEAAGGTVREPVWISLERPDRTLDVVGNLARIGAQVSEVVADAHARSNDAFVVGLMGDCAHALGFLGGLERHRRAPGVVWFDGHGDICTTQNSTSGYLGGMSLAVAMGWDLDSWRSGVGLAEPIAEDAVALVGTSDLDPPEVQALAEHDAILHMNAEDLSAAGGVDRLRQALTARAANAADWHLHVDVDLAGPHEVPGCMTPTPNWPARDDIVEAAGAAASALGVRGVTLASYNPGGDPARVGHRLGLDVVRSALAAVARTERAVTAA